MITFSGGTVKGNIVAPPSKDQTFRAVFLSALAFGKSAVRNPLICEDTNCLIDALRSFDVPIDERNGDLYISGGFLRAPAHIDCGCSKDTLEIMTSFCSIFHKEIVIDSSYGRSISQLTEALKKNGTECRNDPISLKGPMNGGEITIEGTCDPGIVSSLMMTAPLLRNGLRIKVADGNTSDPKITMTETIMSKYDVPVFYENDIVRVEYGGYKPAMFNVSGDYTASAYYMVAAALAGSVSVYGLEPNDVQSGKVIERILKEAGADVSRMANATVVKKDALMGRSIDAGNIPELVPLLAVLCAGSSGKSSIFGISGPIMDGTVRFIKSLGGMIERTDDGCVITGTSHLKGGVIDCGGSPEIAMSAAIASLIADSEISVENAECIDRSYPNFINDIRSIGIK